MDLKFKREDGNIISTVSPWCMAWYGNYETAIIKPDGEIRILEGYDTAKEAFEGHEKYCNMSTEELENLSDVNDVIKSYSIFVK